VRGPEGTFGPLALALLLALPGGPVRATDQPDKPAEELEAVEQELEAGQARRDELEREAEAIEREVKALRAALVETGQRTLELERELSRFEAQLASLSAEEAVAREALAAHRDGLEAALAAAERLALFPPEAALAAPGGPDDAVRTAIVLRGLVPELQDRMQAVLEKVERIAELREGIAEQRAAIELAQAELSAERGRTAELLDRKAALLSQTDAERQAVADQVAALADRAENLRGLIEEIEAEAARKAQEAAEAAAAAQQASAQPGPETAPRPGPVARPDGVRTLAGARGELSPPVAGEVVQAFGNSGRHFGTNDRGVVFETRPGARVVAPFDGRVAFAGPFRGYGRILIIDHGEGYHSLLIGLDRIDTTVNQWLLAGEPVGTVGRRSGGVSALYLELRKRGRPIDPLPWLAHTPSEASG